MIYFSDFGSVVAADAPEYIDKADFGNATSGSVAFPTIAAGDVCIAAIETADEAMPTPTGATFNSIGNVASTGATRLTLFWALLDGSETTFSYGDSGDHQIGQIYIIRGCTLPGGSPVHQTNSADGTSASGSLPGFTTTEANCLVLGIVGTSDFGSSPNTFANSDLASVTPVTVFGSGAGNNGHVAMAYGVKVTAGSVGAMTFTPAPAPFWAGFQIALR